MGSLYNGCIYYKTFHNSCSLGRNTGAICQHKLSVTGKSLLNRLPFSFAHYSLNIVLAFFPLYWETFPTKCACALTYCGTSANVSSIEYNGFCLEWCNCVFLLSVKSFSALLKRSETALLIGIDSYCEIVIANGIICILLYLFIYIYNIWRNSS